MITATTTMKGPVECRVTHMTLKPRSGWEKTPEEPQLKYEIEMDIPIPSEEGGMSEMVTGILTLGTALSKSGKPFGLGFESGTSLRETVDRYSARPALDEDGRILLDKDGLPVPDPEDPNIPQGTSHWCIARNVPIRMNAVMTLGIDGGAITIKPRRIRSGDRKGELVVASSDGQQRVSVFSSFEPGLGEFNREIDGRYGEVNVTDPDRKAGSHVAQWAMDEIY